MFWFIHHKEFLLNCVYVEELQHKQVRPSTYHNITDYISAVIIKSLKWVQPCSVMTHGRRYYGNKRLWMKGGGDRLDQVRM